MPPRGASASGGAKRVRKPAMKRGRGGGHASSGGAPKGGGGGSGSGSGSAGARSARARPGRLARAKIPRGDAAAHRQQAFFEVDEDEDDYAGRGARAAEDPELGGGAGGEAYDDLPEGFDDEEHLKALFEEFDTDKSGTVDMCEYLEHSLIHPAHSRRRVAVLAEADVKL